MRTALFPGTFDPITEGHLDILRRAMHVFDKVIVAVAAGIHKETLFSWRNVASWWSRARRASRGSPSWSSTACSSNWPSARTRWPWCAACASSPTSNTNCSWPS